MRLKLVGIFICVIMMLGIFIIYTNQSIGKESDKMNYESRENFINKGKIVEEKGNQNTMKVLLLVYRL
ncbi:hypothetical protein BwiPL1_09590 [Bacillus wiedmannii]|nr:hypothetical protein BwiPL1_09590 [Bacillus wiedmannii]